MGLWKKGKYISTSNSQSSFLTVSLPSFEIGLITSEASREYVEAAISDLEDLVFLLPHASLAQTGLETCRHRGTVLSCPCSETRAGGAESARSLGGDG